jgi:hypothetical protein
MRKAGDNTHLVFGMSGYTFEKSLSDYSCRGSKSPEAQSIADQEKTPQSKISLADIKK